jgi:filamentous hemagglutinin
MSAQDRLARENLVNSLVAGIAATGGVNAATATGAAQVEVENNQVSVVDWAKRTYESPVEDIARWAKEFAGKVASSNGQTPSSDADPLADATNGGKPPTGAAGAVVTPALAGIVAAACAEGNLGACASMAMGAAATTPGYAPSAATLNNGNGDEQATDSAAKGNPNIQFGANDNQSSHTFRHVISGGYDATAVQNAVTSDLNNVRASLPQGQYTGTVVVNGTTFTYSSYKLPDGTINVGRITPPR